MKAKKNKTRKIIFSIIGIIALIVLMYFFGSYVLSVVFWDGYTPYLNSDDNVVKTYRDLWDTDLKADFTAAQNQYVKQFGDCTVTMQKLVDTNEITSVDMVCNGDRWQDVRYHEHYTGNGFFLGGDVSYNGEIVSYAHNYNNGFKSGSFPAGYDFIVRGRFEGHCGSTLSVNGAQVETSAILKSEYSGDNVIFELKHNPSNPQQYTVIPDLDTNRATTFTVNDDTVELSFNIVGDCSLNNGNGRVGKFILKELNYKIPEDCTLDSTESYIVKEYIKGDTIDIKDIQNEQEITKICRSNMVMIDDNGTMSQDENGQILDNILQGSQYTVTQDKLYVYYTGKPSTTCGVTEALNIETNTCVQISEDNTPPTTTQPPTTTTMPPTTTTQPTNSTNDNGNNDMDLNNFANFQTFAIAGSLIAIAGLGIIFRKRLFK